MNRGGLSAAQVEATIREVCHLEIRALKPGNVSAYSPGHRMLADDFIRSAEAIAPVMASPALRVGQRIRQSVEVTAAAVGCNTNLGIVLLLAPLAEAVLKPIESGNLGFRLRAVLAGLSVEDARDTYAAIRLASPGGLGSSAEQDVAGAPTVTLLKAMELASDRDRIAYQYASGYSDIFGTGMGAVRAALDRGWGEEWAAVACYLRFAATLEDSHVARKFGTVRAEAVRQRAARLESHFKACDNPLTAVPMLLDADEELKTEGINPGTSADLTVATLAVCRFDSLLTSG